MIEMVDGKPSYLYKTQERALHLIDKNQKPEIEHEKLSPELNKFLRRLTSGSGEVLEGPGKYWRVQGNTGGFGEILEGPGKYWRVGGNTGASAEKQKSHQQEREVG